MKNTIPSFLLTVLLLFNSPLVHALDAQFSQRLKEAAERAVLKHPEWEGLNTIIKAQDDLRAATILYPQTRPAVKMAMLSELQILDCVSLLKLNLEWLTSFARESGDIDSNFSDQMPHQIREAERFSQLVIDRVNDNEEWGAVANEVRRAQKVFTQLAKLPVTRWVSVAPHELVNGEPAVHKKVADPIQAVVIQTAVDDANDNLDARLSLIARELEMGFLRRGFSRASAACLRWLI